MRFPPPLPPPQQAPPGKRAAAPYPVDAENRAPQQPAATQAITAAPGTAAQAIAAAAVPEAPQRDEFEKCIVRGALDAPLLQHYDVGTFDHIFILLYDSVWYSPPISRFKISLHSHYKYLYSKRCNQQKDPSSG